MQLPDVVYSQSRAKLNPAWVHSTTVHRGVDASEGVHIEPHPRSMDDILDNITSPVYSALIFVRLYGKWPSAEDGKEDAAQRIISEFGAPGGKGLTRESESLLLAYAAKYPARVRKALVALAHRHTLRSDSDSCGGPMALLKELLTKSGAFEDHAEKAVVRANAAFLRRLGGNQNSIDRLNRELTYSAGRQSGEELREWPARARFRAALRDKLIEPLVFGMLTKVEGPVRHLMALDAAFGHSSMQLASFRSSSLMGIKDAAVVIEAAFGVACAAGVPEDVLIAGQAFWLDVWRQTYPHEDGRR